ncbi:MAG TPA: ABC-2 family transporter protein [Kofleriaceae bacterium]|nr:ABC-2 family transporter protein [Kofleriaceae bacterium]
MNRPSVYLHVGRTAARSHLAYLGEVAARATFLTVLLYIFLQLWRITYAETGADRLGGFTLAQMLWYLAMTEAIILSAPPVTPAIDQDARTGGIAVHLLRPISYPFYRLWVALGEQLVRFALNALVGAVLATALVGPAPLAARGVAMFLVAIPLAFTLDFTAHLGIGLCAFWLEDTSGLALLYRRATMLLGGVLLPIDLFPAGLRSALAFLPFRDVVYGPAHLFVQPDGDFLVRLLVRQATGVAALGLVAAAVYRAGVRRIHAHGG